jgi:hypothetical protein
MRQWIGAPRTGAEYGQREDERRAMAQKAKALRDKSKVPRVRAMKKILAAKRARGEA